MKFLAATFITALLAFAGGLFFPWWIIAVTSFITAIFIHQRAGGAFISGFMGVFLMWGIYTSIVDLMNHHLLAIKIANVLPLGGSFVTLIVITAIVGGLVSGFAAMTGSYTRSINSTRKPYNGNKVLQSDLS